MDADLGQEALTLMTYPLPKGPPPNTITLGVRIEHINLEGGEHKHSNHSTLRQLKDLGEARAPQQAAPSQRRVYIPLQPWGHRKGRLFATGTHVRRPSWLQGNLTWPQHQSGQVTMGTVR